MKHLAEGIFYFPLKDGEEAIAGGIYEIVDGKAQALEGAPTGNIIGVCMGGDKMREGELMLSIDPTAVYTEAYTEEPTIGAFVDNVKLVIAVDTDAKLYDYILRVAAE